MTVHCHSQTFRRSRLTPWCSSCALRHGSGFEDFAAPELTFMDSFKVEHGVARAGDILIRQGDPSPRLFTLFSGWAVRVQNLTSGQRQLLSIALPGDLLGLESVVFGESRHSVEAVTDVSFCVFDPGRVDELLGWADLARRLVRLQVSEQRHMDERLTAVGACDARRSFAFLIWDLYHRLQRRDLVRGLSFKLPLTQQQLADALGLTTVHVHRTARSLRQEGVLRIDHRLVIIQDLERLCEAACVAIRQEEPAPLL